MYPKVLIISHNLFEITNNIGKTLISLFEGWPKDRICQIYLRNDNPSFEYCENYYQILDKEVAKSIISRKQPVGSEILKQDGSTDEPLEASEQSLYQIGNKRYPIVSLVRDMVWSTQNWKNSALDAWIEKMSPEVILFVPNDYELIYPIALYVQFKCNIPIVPFYMDDAFYFTGGISLIDVYRRRRLRKLGHKINELSQSMLVIGPKMAGEYAEIFHKECIPVMNSVIIDSREDSKEENNDFVFSYVGNLHSNRWKVLVDIAKKIPPIIDGKKVVLNIYSASVLEKKVLKQFEKNPVLHMKGRVSPNKVPDILKKSDVLIFVEAFDRKSKLSTRLSLSTKIPEYLNSGTPILAVGPQDISAMEYLAGNNLAFVSDENIDQALNRVLDSDERKRIAKNAREFVKNNHNIDDASRIFQNVLIEVSQS